MRTLEEIKDDYAREHGYDDWNEVIYSSSDPDTLDKACDEVAKRYAIEVAKQMKKTKRYKRLARSPIKSMDQIKHLFI